LNDKYLLSEGKSIDIIYIGILSVLPKDW